MRCMQKGSFYLLEYFLWRVSCLVYDSSTWNILILLLLSTFPILWVSAVVGKHFVLCIFVSSWSVWILLECPSGLLVSFWSMLMLFFRDIVSAKVSSTGWWVRVQSYFCWWIVVVFFPRRDNVVLMVSSTGRLA